MPYLPRGLIAPKVGGSGNTSQANVRSTPCPPASDDTNRKATTTSSPSVATTVPYLNTPAARDRFLSSLESSRKRYCLEVMGYVVMPEHVHLLLSEPESELLAKALQALKVSVSKLSVRRPFWQIRYHDFNVLTHNKRVEKLETRACVKTSTQTSS